MKGKITVNSVSTVGHHLEISYSLEGEAVRYFNTQCSTFRAEYNEEDISNVPNGIAVIPFVGNVLPIVWLADLELVVPELDSGFLECLPEVRHGYMLLSPMLDFLGGRLTVKQIVDYNYTPSQQEAVLFSGGVDAFATLLGHVDAKPVLITLRGADVALDDDKGWSVVTDHVRSTAETFGLPAPQFVETNFRQHLDYGNLWRLVRRSPDDWWHGYQHGLGIICHTAPLAWLHRLDRVYIASSFTYDHSFICASDPVIDSHVRFAGTEVRHDGYYMNRIEKVHKIVTECERLEKNIRLRVCWISRGGHNCCKCEKCIRTIFNILAVGGNPEQYGFKIMTDVARQYKSIVEDVLLDHQNIKFSWYEIQDYAREHKPVAIVNNDNYNWILSLNIDRNRPAVMKMLRKLKRGIRKIKRVIKNT